MALKAGIVGLPNVGKSSLFSALTNLHIEMANYPFTTIEPNISVVEVKDKRLDVLANIVKPKKIVHATFEFVDIAGLVAGASKGEGLGNQFLANIKEVDLIVHVVRCFEDKNIIHVANSLDPIRDLEIINLELILADLQSVEKIIQRIQKRALNTGDAALKFEYITLLRVKESLEKSLSLRDIDFSENELRIVKLYQFLSIKPIIYVANVGMEDLKNPNNFLLSLQNYLTKLNQILIPLSVQFELEASQLKSEEEKQDFLEMFEMEKLNIDILIQTTFHTLGLRTYFTAGVQELRAWVFKENMNAQECAGIIHTDFAKKFIKAEIISYEDYVKHGGEKNSKENGKMKLEGKTYLMKDGDICYFHFGK
ncbi:redox-regulated ATPase YchF [[Mycoplasma] mobile]|uniref:Ribosome-binding ATPase YchF n=1 Tax=Mycoplasma mobile (strain ATCC 43663 / 163K / NCTC 11711) TaxID=267748 RepID=Q6KH43_MYCM1|nr:redox-regulated ATPase YchF [[Mycoplasma] mobile]AAT28088.1 putative GTPase translation factor [Mycoplasma mobile 163K]